MRAPGSRASTPLASRSSSRRPPPPPPTMPAHARPQHSAVLLGPAAAFPHPPRLHRVAPAARFWTLPHPRSAAPAYFLPASDSSTLYELQTLRSDRTPQSIFLGPPLTTHLAAAAAAAPAPAPAPDATPLPANSVLKGTANTTCAPSARRAHTDPGPLVSARLCCRRCRRLLLVLRWLSSGCLSPLSPAQTARCISCRRSTRSFSRSDSSRPSLLYVSRARPLPFHFICLSAGLAAGLAACMRIHTRHPAQSTDPACARTPLGRTMPRASHS